MVTLYVSIPSKDREANLRALVCVHVFLLYREVVELWAGEEAFTGTRTGVTWSAGLWTQSTQFVYAD